MPLGLAVIQLVQPRSQASSETETCSSWLLRQEARSSARKLLERRARHRLPFRDGEPERDYDVGHGDQHADMEAGARQMRPAVAKLIAALKQIISGPAMPPNSRTSNCIFR